MSPLLARLEARAGARWPTIERLLAAGELVLAADVPAPTCRCIPWSLPIETDAKSGEVRCLLCGRSVAGLPGIRRWDWWRHPARMASARTSS